MKAQVLWKLPKLSKYEFKFWNVDQLRTIGTLNEGLRTRLRKDEVIRQELIDWLILTAFQLVNGYFITKGWEIVLIVRL